MRLRRRAWAAALGAAVLSAGPATARADELTITAQAVLAHGEFLTQAPAPPVQGVLCEVDAGVSLNPDTEPILGGRESILGGTVDDVSESSHGTYVAMVAGAAANGWGMVGAWPRLKVYSVRTLAGGEETSASAYRQAIQRCIRAKVDSHVDVRVIELAVGGPRDNRDPRELSDIADSVARARQNGIVVISAAGNDGGAVNVPASVGPVLSVSGIDSTGSLCGFSSRGPEVDLAVLGCDMDVAALPDGAPGVGQSTSLASAYAAGVVVALRSYRPELSVEQTEALLRASARPSVAGPILDAGAAFRAAGLGGLVDAYRPPTPPGASLSPRRRPCHAKRRVCPRPKLRSVRGRGGRVVIRLARVPARSRVIVRADGRRVAATRSRIIRLSLRRWKTLTIRFRAPARAPSPVLRIKGADVR